MSRPGLHICIIMEYHRDDVTGGAEVQVFTLARRFAQLGHQVTYVCQRYDPRTPRDAMVDGVRVLRVLRWRRVFRWAAAVQLARNLRRLQPDVIYQRGATPFTGLAALAARVADAPFVWGCAEDLQLSGGVLRGASQVGSQRRPRGLAKSIVLRLNGAVNQWLFDRGLRATSAVVVQSSLQQRLLNENYGLQGTVIPNGVELTEPTGDRSPAPLVLWLNNVMRRKRPELFIELARSLAERHPGAEFAMVGGRAEDEYMRELRGLAQGVPGLVFYGRVPYSETHSWFSRAWIYVLTSESEGFPNVMLQAWVAGTPVVSLSIDPENLLRDEGLGRLSASAENLARDVSELLSDTALRVRMGRDSREYAATHLEAGSIARRYIELFQRIVKT